MKGVAFVRCGFLDKMTASNSLFSSVMSFDIVTSSFMWIAAYYRSTSSDEFAYHYPLTCGFRSSSLADWKLSSLRSAVVPN